jgi:hypothetical protein
VPIGAQRGKGQKRAKREIAKGKGVKKEGAKGERANREGTKKENPPSSRKSSSRGNHDISSGIYGIVGRADYEAANTALG